MEVDSSMLSEVDHDLAQEQGTASPPAEMEGDQDGEQPSGGNGSSTQSTATSQQQASSTPHVQQIPVVGPRHAPTYSVVNALMDKKEDGPGPRCGHTLTAVSSVGEEGTPGYLGPRLILFGGATALEGNSAATGTPTSAGNAGIRMFLFSFTFWLLLSLSRLQTEVCCFLIASWW